MKKMPLQMQIMNTEYDEYVGKLGTGRIYHGKISKNEEVVIVKEMEKNKKSKISRLYVYEGLKELKQTQPTGDIVTIAGIDNIDIGEEYL